MNVTDVAWKYTILGMCIVATGKLTSSMVMALCVATTDIRSPAFLSEASDAALVLSSMLERITLSDCGTTISETGWVLCEIIREHTLGFFKITNAMAVESKFSRTGWFTMAIG